MTAESKRERARDRGTEEETGKNQTEEELERRVTENSSRQLRKRRATHQKGGVKSIWRAIATTRGNFSQFYSACAEARLHLDVK